MSTNEFETEKMEDVFLYKYVPDSGPWKVASKVFGNSWYICNEQTRQLVRIGRFGFPYKNLRKAKEEAERRNAEAQA